METLTREKALELVQEETHLALDLKGGQGIVALATGVGKTKIGLTYIQKQQAHNVLWVVPTEKLRDIEVPNEFQKWESVEYFNEHVTVVCYASLPSMANKQYDYVVLDEAHRISNLRFSFFLRNHASKILCLTATPPHEIEKRHLLHKMLKLDIVIEIGLDDAVLRGLIAPYSITCIGVDLNRDNTYKLKFPNGGFKITSEFAMYRYWSDRIQEMELAGETVPKQIRLRRRTAIMACPSKIEKCRDFVQSLSEDKRIIVFSGTKKNARVISKNVYHSTSGDKCYTDFNDDKLSLLSVVQSINEGVNLFKVDIAVINQIDSNPRNLVQRIGRVVRYREGHQAEIYIFYFKNTIDRIWLKKCTNGLKHQNIKWINYEE